MGAGPSENVKPSDYFKSQGFPDLRDDVTKQDIFAKVSSPSEPFELSEHGFIQEIGMNEKDLAVGNQILQELEKDVGKVEAAGEDPLEQMLRNFDHASKKFKDEGKILTYVNGEERERSLEVVTYDVGSINQVSDSLLASLTVGFGLPPGLSKALVFPKVAEFLKGLSKFYEDKKESYDLKEFTVQFVRVDKEKKCTSVSAYRFRFASSDHSSKYWLFGTKSDSKMYVYCRKVTFLCTKELSADDMFN